MPKLITFSISLSLFVLIASALGFWLILTKLDPQTRVLNPVLFYLDVSALVFSLTFAISLAIRHKFGVREFAVQHLQVSARQSLWLMLLVVVSLVLLSVNLFNWLNGTLVVLCLVFLEAYFLYK